MANLTEFLEFHARRDPGRTALVYQGREIGYGEMHARALAGAGWLAGRGIRAGDVVALWMKNSAAFLDLVFATSRRGAVLLP
ncbi:MAG: AMP-binding protein, partial [Alphaproteobacteria bacterium]